MNRKTTKKVDESTLTTLCAVCRGAFLDAKGVRLRKADPRQLVKDVCTYCQTRYGFDYYVQPIVRMTASGHPGKSTASKRHTSCTSSMAVSATSRCFASSTRRGRAMWIPTLPV